MRFGTGILRRNLPVGFGVPQPTLRTNSSQIRLPNPGAAFARTRGKIASGFTRVLANAATAGGLIHEYRDRFASPRHHAPSDGGLLARAIEVVNRDPLATTVDAHAHRQRPAGLAPGRAPAALQHRLLL